MTKFVESLPKFFGNARSPPSSLPPWLIVKNAVLAVHELSIVVCNDCRDVGIMISRA